MDESYRNAIGKDITLLTAAALEDGRITLEQGQEIARTVLAEIDKPQSTDEMTSFLQSIASRWSIFESLVQSDRLQVDEEQKQQSLSEISTLLKENKIDEALNRTQQLVETPAEGGMMHGS